MLPPMKLPSYLFGMVVVCSALAGCGAGGHPLRIEPVGSKAAAYQPNFKQIYYRVDRDNNVYFYTKAPLQKAKNVEQTLVMRVFWKPIGGKTSLNATALNSTFRYVIYNATGAGSYEGAGFVRFYGKIGKRDLSVRVIDGDLRLTEATSAFVDTLKRSRFRGKFTAHRDDGRTLEATLDAQREFFGRTFAASKAPPPAATQGAGTASTTHPATTQPSTQ
jgi:hypothetical protein